MTDAAVLAIQKIPTFALSSLHVHLFSHDFPRKRNSVFQVQRETNFRHLTNQEEMYVHHARFQREIILAEVLIQDIF